jgi:ribosome-binding factor A
MTTRTAKVNALLEATIAEAIRRDYGDPTNLVTVTKVEVAPDLRTANVWIATYRDGTWEDIMALRPLLQRAVAAAMTSKNTPRLTLRQDLSGEYAARIHEALRGRDS